MAIENIIEEIKALNSKRPNFNTYNKTLGNIIIRTLAFKYNIYVDSALAYVAYPARITESESNPILSDRHNTEKQGVSLDSRENVLGVLKMKRA